jgi:iron complex transport system substrate-binding protein
MNKSLICWIVLSWICCAMWSCGDKQQAIQTPDAAVMRTLRPRYAEGFSIDYLADSTRRIVMFNLDSPGDTLQVIRWKPEQLSNIASLSTTHVSFIHSLGRLEDLKGVGFADRLMDADARARFNNGLIVNLTAGNELDPEAVFEVMPQMIFVYPFGTPSYEKFLQRGIGCVQVSEYLEHHPLGRAEWIKLFGVFLSEELKADSIFVGIEKSYLHLRDSIQQTTTQRPIVFTASMDGDRWAVPSANSFMATLLRDAGGRYLFTDTSATGNLILPFETFLTEAAKADYWGKIIYDANPSTEDAIVEGDIRLKSLGAFANHHVFYCNAQQTDYHGKAILEPHILLRDLSVILHPLDSANATGAYFKPWLMYQ